MKAKELKFFLKDVNDESDIMLYDPNNSKLLDVNSVSINADSFQLNMPDVRFWYELIEDPEEWDGIMHGYGSHDPEEAMEMLREAVNEDGWTEAFLQVYDGESNEKIEKLYL